MSAAPAPPASKRWAAVVIVLLLALIATLPSEPVDLHRPARPLPWAGLEWTECGP